MGFHDRIFVCLGVVFLSLAAQGGLKLSPLVPSLNFPNVVEQREFITALSFFLNSFANTIISLVKVKLTFFLDGLF